MASALTIRLLPAFEDNYLFLLEDAERNWRAVVDPGDSAVVEAALGGRPLQEIWITHHHDDHIGGVEALVARTGARVTGPHGERGALPSLDHAVTGGDGFSAAGHTVNVLAVPGHTLGHVAYHLPGPGVVFVGDTLFAMGCGRLFEGTPAQMWESLDRLRQLPEATWVYCAHEYTLSNLAFALSLGWNRSALERRAEQEREKRREGRPTVPFRLGEERLTNPFLRADDPDLQTVLGAKGAVDGFAVMRRRKDHFSA